MVMDDKGNVWNCWPCWPKLCRCGTPISFEEMQRGPGQPEGTPLATSGSSCLVHGESVVSAGAAVPQCLPARVMAALASPMTTDELRRQLRVFSKPAREAVDKLHRRQDIHIEGWDTSGGQPRARWVVGAGQDAPKPRRVWASAHCESPPQLT
jgi:hypothetical protein